MAWKNLGEFLTSLEEKGDLVRVRSKVSPRLEMTELALRALRADGPALLFEQVEGSDWPVAINVLGSDRRIAQALGREDLGEAAGTIADLLAMKPPSGIVEMIREPGKTLDLLQQLRSLAPKRVSTAACQKNETDRVDLDRLPILTCWPKDGGPTVTFPLVITKNPETGESHTGIYRLQRYGADTLGMHWQTHRVGAENFRRWSRTGKDMPVAVVIGADPASIFSSLAPVPEGISKFAFSGLMRGKPVELVSCRTVDLEVPAESEFVLEGYVRPGESHVEGPFGDHTGYYSLPEPFPVMHVTHMTWRDRPTYLATVTGKPPTEDAVLGRAITRLFLPVIRMVLPEVKDMDLPMEGLFINLAVVSIRKSYPYHARKVMHALWGLGQMMFVRYIVVVDEDVNPHDLREVLYRVSLQADPAEDFELVRGPVDQLSVSNRLENVGGKVGIDATKKWPGEGYPRPWPEEARMDPAVQARIDTLLSAEPRLAQVLSARR